MSFQVYRSQSAIEEERRQREEREREEREAADKHEATVARSEWTRHINAELRERDASERRRWEKARRESQKIELEAQQLADQIEKEERIWHRAEQIVAERSIDPDPPLGSL